MLLCNAMHELNSICNFNVINTPYNIYLQESLIIKLKLINDEFNLIITHTSLYFIISLGNNLSYIFTFSYVDEFHTLHF